MLDKVLLATPKVHHTSLWKNGIRAYWPRHLPQDEYDPTEGNITVALIEAARQWQWGDGPLSLQKLLLVALEDPAYKLRACIHDAAKHGHAHTLQTVESLEEWW